MFGVRFVNGVKIRRVGNINFSSSVSCGVLLPCNCSLILTSGRLDKL